MEKIGENQFKLGLIEFDKQSREIRFPAWVNMNKGMIEFPVVHRNGRVHEAIFATDALPLHLETVLRLLRYKPSKEVFPQYPGIDLKNPPPPDKWPEPVYPAAEPASYVQVLARWNNAGGQSKEVDVRDLLQRATLDASGNAGPVVRFADKGDHWVYTGSTEKMKETVESLGGAIVGVRPEPECCINTVREKEAQEGEWFADESRVPALETPVTIIIRPFESKKAAAPALAPTPTPAPPPTPAGATPPNTPPAPATVPGVPPSAGATPPTPPASTPSR